MNSPTPHYGFMVSPDQVPADEIIISSALLLNPVYKKRISVFFNHEDVIVNLAMALQFSGSYSWHYLMVKILIQNTPNSPILYRRYIFCKRFTSSYTCSKTVRLHSTQPDIDIAFGIKMSVDKKSKNLMLHLLTCYEVAFSYMIFLMSSCVWLFNRK